MDFLRMIKGKLQELINANGLDLNDEVEVISARSLSPEEAIGHPERDDFPLLKGKEVMIEAIFRQARGQAYTDMPGNYRGKLRDVLSLPLKNNYERAVFVATLNAVMRHLGLVERTVHCRDQEPGQCANHLVAYVQQRFGRPKIAFIGLQPAMVASLAPHFPLRVTDLDPENVGQLKAGILIEPESATSDVLAWADVILATGTTAVNGSLTTLIGQKPIVFYGVTIAGIARLMGYEQYCFHGH